MVIPPVTGNVTHHLLLVDSTPVLQTLEVTPATAEVERGTSQNFTVTGTYSDGSTADVTSQVEWSSSDTGVAAIDAAGRATTTQVGATTITATLDSVTNSATLTVTKEPTALVAHQATRQLVLLQYRYTLSATLTSAIDNTPIPNRNITFQAPSARTCAATTDPTGRATCTVTYLVLFPPSAASTYTATYAGDTSTLPTTSTGPMH